MKTISIEDCGYEKRDSMVFEFTVSGNIMFVVTDEESWQSETSCWISQRLYFAEPHGPGSFVTTSIHYKVGDGIRLQVDRGGHVFVGGFIEEGGGKIVPLEIIPAAP
jgi:hypothetical protein